MSSDDVPSAHVFNVYIDGFNFYYGALKGHDEYKWLNLHKFARYMLREVKSEIAYNSDCLVRIKYFTADIKSLARPFEGHQYAGRALKFKIRQEEKVARQKSYLRLLNTEKNTEIVRGYYSVKVKSAWAVKKIDPEGKKDFNNVCYTEHKFYRLDSNEKGTDVNLAVRLIADSHGHDERHAYGPWAVVISNDADLKSAIEYIRQYCAKKVLLVNPQAENGESPSMLERAADLSIRLHERAYLDHILKSSQFPEVFPVMGKTGKTEIKNPYRREK